MYNAGYAFGEWAGPFLGGLLAQILDFERATSILGITILSIAVFYLFASKLLFGRSSMNE